MNSHAKSLLYHELGQLLRAGISLPRAVEKLLPVSHGASKSALRKIAEVLSSGGTASEALSAPKEFGALDAAILSASEKSGRLERGFAQAAEYHETVAAARARLLTKVLYPVFILNLAGLAFSLPLLVGPEGSGARALQALGQYLAILWGSIIAVVLLSRWLSKVAAVNPAVDRFLSVIPVVGKLRRAFAVSRFSLAYDMQLEAGINVMSALESAATASGSARYLVAAHEGLPSLRAGESLSTVLTKSGSFPAPFLRAVIVGEDTGQLEAELHRVALSYRESALRRLDLLVEWLPRIALILVAVYVGWRVVDFYTGMFRNLSMGL
jgi:type IV pilus assembly protein PilC